MKTIKYLALILLLCLTLITVSCLLDKSSQFSCTWHLEKYKAALKVILAHKDLLVKNNKLPANPKWQAQIITRQSVEQLNQKSKHEYEAILYLWDKQLISDDYGIMFSDSFWQSIDFDLPGEGKVLCYLPSNKFDFTCASGQVMVHKKLEKDWYYVHYCPD
jgi:hypothetical protein